MTDVMIDVIVGAMNFAIFVFLSFIMFLVVRASAHTGEDKCLKDEAQEEFCKTYNQKRKAKKEKNRVKNQIGDKGKGGK